MAVTAPYRRNVRMFTDGTYANSGKWMYVKHPKHAESPEQFVRAFLLLQKDLLDLFNFIEPSDQNLPCYSYRTHELLLRACVEVEANCKAIMRENGYSRGGDWNMNDYKKIEKSHRLSRYEVKLPVWNGSRCVREPFAAWAAGGSLPWYTAYNTTKHDRHDQFHLATFEQLTDAMCGLVALLGSQFWTEDYSGKDYLLGSAGPRDGTESAIGGYFRIRFPTIWPASDQYEFDWEVLKGAADPFQNFAY